MKPELVSKLREDFPNTSIPEIDCGDGWYFLIRSILKHIDYVKVNVGINQIKSKFGGLRFYYSFHSSKNGDAYVERDRAELNGFINGMEVMSRYVCQYCGEFEEGKIEIKEWACVKCVTLHKIHNS
jgi:hypothetical protein